MKNNDAIDTLKDNDITDKMFLIEANRYIFQAIDYLHSKKTSASPTAIMEVMKNSYMKKIVEEFGGSEYLSILASSEISESNITIFCEKLKQAYVRRKLIENSLESAEFLLSDKAEILNPSELINKYETNVVDLQTETMQVKEIYKMGSDAEEILAKRAESPNTVPGIEIGWNKFDYYTNGGQPGDLFMICARAKTGKSALLTNWAVNLGIRDKMPVLYIDTEMTAREQEDRILSILSGVPNKEIISGMYVVDTEFGKAEDKIKAVRSAIKQLNEGQYYHTYMPYFTIDKINAIAKKFKTQYNIRALFFDYLKLPSSDLSSLKSAAEWQMLGYIASGLKDIAGTLKIPVYSACQENRSNLDGKKDERNVGGSDRILQLATKLMFLSNKTDEEIIKGGGAELNGNQKLSIVYQRNGESNCPDINIFYDRIRLHQSEVLQ